jgi:CheY-like chemotaxis protein
MSCTILILDDDPVTLFLHKVIIEKSEFSLTPVAFSSGSETLAYLERHCEKHKSFLIFLDINMPGMSGWEFMERLNAKTCAGQVTVVIVSSSIDRADYARANGYKQVGGYLEKPISIEMINEVKGTSRVKEFLGPKETSKLE